MATIIVDSVLVNALGAYVEHDGVLKRAQSSLPPSEVATRLKAGTLLDTAFLKEATLAELEWIDAGDTL